MGMAIIQALFTNISQLVGYLENQIKLILTVNPIGTKMVLSWAIINNEALKKQKIFWFWKAIAVKFIWEQELKKPLAFLTRVGLQGEKSREA